MGPPGGDDLPFLFSGTLVTGGQGLAEVHRTGLRTELGKIGKAIQTLEPEQTLLQKETGRLVRYLAVVGLALCGIVVVAYGLSRGGSAEAWQGGFLAGITMAMATLPEELPVILTIFLALGAWRISQSRVLTRRMPAIETLGAATVLCVDKTGTLTLNQMTVQQTLLQRRGVRRRRERGDSCRKRFTGRWNLPFWRANGIRSIRWKRPSGCWATKYLASSEHLHNNWTLVHEYPLSPELLALSHVWQSPDGSDYVVAAKGAPEAIADLCHFTAREREPLTRAGGDDGRARSAGSCRGRRSSETHGIASRAT